MGINNGFIITWMYYNNLNGEVGIYYIYYPITFTAHVGISVTGYTTESNFTSGTANAPLLTRSMYNDHNIDVKTHIGIQNKTKCTIIVIGY